MKKVFWLFLFLTGCSPGYVTDYGLSEGDQYCGMITDVSELLSVYMTEKDSVSAVDGVIPGTTVNATLRADIDRTVHRLAEDMTNDVTAIRSVLFTIIVLRNLAPCDDENIKYSWIAVNNAIGALERHYGDK